MGKIQWWKLTTPQLNEKSKQSIKGCLVSVSWGKRSQFATKKKDEKGARRVLNKGKKQHKKIEGRKTHPNHQKHCGEGCQRCGERQPLTTAPGVYFQEKKKKE